MGRSFRDRVNRAHAGLLGREDSREMDDCFEQYDGAFVVAALMRRAEGVPALRAAIEAHGPAMLVQWQTTAKGLAHLRNEDALAKAARAHRRREIEKARARVAAWALQVRPAEQGRLF